jgi:hypothetical protein
LTATSSKVCFGTRFKDIEVTNYDFGFVPTLSRRTVYPRIHLQLTDDADTSAFIDILGDKFSRLTLTVRGQGQVIQSDQVECQPSNHRLARIKS